MLRFESNMSNKAYLIVSDAFKDIKDNAGQPYIGHLIRVANGINQNLDFHETEILTTVALLHDIIEDTNWTIEDLHKEFPSEVVDSVFLLTKVKGQKYEDYIESLSKNIYSVIVKISDLKDNMDVTRLSNLGDYELKRLKKYHDTYIRLKSILNEHF